MSFQFSFDALYLAQPSNLFYFSGYTNEDARILITPDGAFYISDARVREEAQERLKQFTFVDAPRGDYTAVAIKLIEEGKYRQIGYEGKSITHAEFVRLTQACKVEWQDASAALEQARSVKTEQELACIQAAQRITDQVYTHVLGLLRPGISEEELAAQLNAQIYVLGGVPAFDTIVAFGENTSKPHAHPGARTLQRGDPITLDFGAKRNGYCSDMTRSLCFGEPQGEYRTIYQLVADAQQLALDGVHAGMTGRECDAIARKYFEKHGYSEYFTHSLGHSLGIDIHEAPTFSPGNTRPIPANAVISFEPGLYFPGKFGVRIEDIGIVKNIGVENLTKSEKTLIII